MLPPSFLVAYVSGQLIDMGFEAVYPLWAISSVGSGGLDWSTKDVGQVRDTAVF